MAAHALVGCHDGAPLLLSGITVIKPDEVAVILRWGRLVGDTPALQEHGPGLLFAFPRPVDRVVRVQVKHVWEVPVTTLCECSGGQRMRRADSSNSRSSDAGLCAHGRSEHCACGYDRALSRAGPCRMGFLWPQFRRRPARRGHGRDGSFAGRDGCRPSAFRRPQDLIATATRRAQAGLDASHSGLELSSLELTSFDSAAGS